MNRLIPYLIFAAMQAMQLRVPAPSAGAANADWQINNEPIVVQGLTYYPTLETRMFDPDDMMQVDVYKNVPVYADVSKEPFTLVFVPLTADRLRTYERPRDEDPAAISGRGRAVPRAIGTTGTMVPSPPLVAAEPSPGAGGIESIPPPRRADGVWIEYLGSRWYHDGTAIPHTADHFVRIGEYHGFAVYRERGSPADRIWVAAVKDGPLTPYRKR